MESIKNSIQDLTQHFNTKMAEFQQNLNSSIPATSPTSHIAAQFSAFRSFVLTALEGLQLQVQLLTKQQDNFEMLSRRKMLLIHGVSEDKNEDLASTGIRLLSKHLKMPDLSPDDISRCHRLGYTVSDHKPRPILFKFRKISIRNKVWFSKTNLKSSGFTLSEFLTKPRHDAFVTARQRFGISRCWTRDGLVIVVGPEGKRHRITSIPELNSLFGGSDYIDTTAPAPPLMSAELKGKQVQVTRTKRTIKK